MCIDDIQSNINTLISDLRLPNSYRNTVTQWLAPITKQLARSLKAPSSIKSAPNKGKKSQALVLGIQGAQGSGKSTCSEFLKLLFEKHYQLSTTILSIDDFYLTRKEREQLAHDVHPLLKTRGVPGTHDVELAINSINTLKNQSVDDQSSVIRFNKAIDDRASEDCWDVISGKVDIIILEGWFTGLMAQKPDDISHPINTLESEEDSNGQWREFVNQKLRDEYAALFNLLDYLLVLKAPSFDCVYNWRLTQEQKLQDTVKNSNTSNEQLKIMSPDMISRFISHYERLTKHALATLPGKSNWCLHLNEAQTITRQTSTTPPYVIFTDLDGTLLDHYSYQWQAATPSLETTKKYDIPVIINTSKTAPEVIALQEALSLDTPFIVENGSALFIPIEYFNAQQLNSDLPTSQCGQYKQVIFGTQREDIVSFLLKIKQQHHFKFSSYSDWDINTLMKITGLDTVSAEHSLNREFSEPLVWDDSDEHFERFQQLIFKQGLKILKGGRFIHVLGKTDKAKPMRYMMAQFFNTRLTQSICLGDSPNDIDMLNEADYSVCVKSPTSKYPKLKNKKNIIHTEGHGPEGWNEAIKSILKI